MTGARLQRLQLQRIFTQRRAPGASPHRLLVATCCRHCVRSSRLWSQGARVRSQWSSRGMHEGHSHHPPLPLQRTPMRKHGFQRPWHTLQLVSWVVFSFLGLSFHFILLPAFASSAHRWALGLTYWVAAGPMIWFGWRMTGSEPLDALVRDARLARARLWTGEGPPPGVYAYPLASETAAQREARRCDPAIHAMAVDPAVADGARHWCPYCYEHVHPSSKHCRLCDKCVYEFDHHCKWLNSCVGGRNYHLFFLAMSFALLLLAYQGAISLFLFISTFQDNYLHESAGSYIRESYGAFDQTLFQVLVALTILLSAPLFLSLFHLFLLHLYLHWRGLTTYEWIMERRDALNHKEEANARESARLEQEAGKGVTIVQAAARHGEQHHETPGRDGHDQDAAYLRSIRSSVEMQPYERSHGHEHETPGHDGDPNDSYHYHHAPTAAAHAQQRHTRGLSRDPSQESIVFPPRTATVTAGGVQLTPSGPFLAAGQADAQQPSRSGSRDRDRDRAHDRDHSEHSQSRSEPPMMDDRTQRQGSLHSGIGRHIVRSRQTSEVAQQPQHHVTMHVPRASYSSRGTRGSPDASMLGDSYAATSTAPVAPQQPTRTASGRQLPPLHHEPAGSLSPPRGEHLPGTIISDRSPLHARNGGGLGVPSSSAGLPATPTATHSFAGGMSGGSSVGALPPPQLSMEEEAAAFLADPHATEPNFTTASQRSRTRSGR